MSVTYDESDLPPESVSIKGRMWERDRFDTASYQWIRPMEADEYDWEPEDVPLVGTDVPIRSVELQYFMDEWHITGSETAGPEYHRPGFTELIGSDWAYSTKDFDEAIEKVHEFIKQLS